VFARFALELLSLESAIDCVHTYALLSKRTLRSEMNASAVHHYVKAVTNEKAWKLFRRVCYAYSGKRIAGKVWW
jgi:hypothetical protein